MNIRVIPLLDAWAIRALVIGIRSPETLPAPARLLLKHLVFRSSRFRESRKPLSTKKGMLGPAFSGTERTPDLMAEAGLIYLAGWTHDDQPTPMKVKSGKLITMPYSVELNDSPIFLNHHEGDYFFRICKAQFDQLYKEGA